MSACPPEESRARSASLAHDAAPRAGPAIRLAWGTDVPTPSVDAELSIVPFLLPGRRAEWKRGGYREERLFEDLPPARRAAVSAAAASHGFALPQALSLRSQLYKDAAPWKFHGTEAASQEAADRLEDAVGRFLRAAGVAFLTQRDLLDDARARGVNAGATPDFLIRSDLAINGQACRWIEVKRFFGAGAVTLKAWNPSRKCPKQVRRYKDEWGPGALVFIHGFSRAFVETMPAGVILLSAAPFRADIDASQAPPPVSAFAAQADGGASSIPL